MGKVPCTSIEDLLAEVEAQKRRQVPMWVVEYATSALGQKRLRINKMLAPQEHDALRYALNHGVLVDNIISLVSVE